MNHDSLLSSQGSFILTVDLEASLTIVDLVRAKKAAAGIIEDLSYDFNESGAVDAEDVNTLRSALLKQSN